MAKAVSDTEIPCQPSHLSSLLGLTSAELEALLAASGEADGKVGMRARQIQHWLYHQGAKSFEDMTTLPADLRSRLNTTYKIDRPKIVSEQHSKDGTIKWLLRLGDNQDIETVYIPDVERGALCISSQVGCSLACTFCHTGTMPLVRNLSPEDMLAQIMVARDRLGDWPTPTGQRKLRSHRADGHGRASVEL